MKHFFRFLCLMVMLCYSMNGFSETTSMRVGDCYTIAVGDGEYVSGWFYGYDDYTWSGVDATYFDVQYSTSHNSSEATGMNNVARITLKVPFQGTKTITCKARYRYGSNPNYRTLTYEITCAPVDVALYPTVMTLPVGGSQTLQWQFNPSNTQYGATATFSSSNQNVAIVDFNGKVTATGLGTTTITATTNYFTTATCQVTVRHPYPVTSVTLGESTLELNEGESRVLTATVLPSNASVSGLAWSSSNHQVAMVNSDGRVTAMGPGYCTITAMSKDGSNIKADCVVHVTSVSNAGDVNLDGNISIADVTTLIDYLLTGVPPVQPTTNTKTYTIGGVTFTMVDVEGGTFMMGATSEQDDPNDREKPVHIVSLSSYSIGQTEVTQALWSAVMGTNPSGFTGNMQNPVESVSWDDCQEFITRLNALTGMSFRLPTEAEWEYAARGGNKSQGFKYAGSNIIDDVCWYTENSGDTTHPVATKSPNELGLYDMSGNVFEWCQDWSDNYSSEAQTNPTGPSTGTYRVARGGRYSRTPWYCRVSYRVFYNPTSKSDGTGLRLAM